MAICCVNSSISCLKSCYQSLMNTGNVGFKRAPNNKGIPSNIDFRACPKFCSQRKLYCLMKRNASRGRKKNNFQRFFKQSNTKICCFHRIQKRKTVNSKKKQDTKFFYFHTQRQKNLFIIASLREKMNKNSL